MSESKQTEQPYSSTESSLSQEGGTTASKPNVDDTMRRMSRRSFLWAGASVLAGYTGWKWLSTRRADDGIPWPLRRTLDINEQLSRDLFSSTRLAATFPKSMAAEPRPNGDIGLEEEIDLAEWRLKIEGVVDKSEAVSLTLDEIKALPRIEIVTELKCIEGWSQVVHWAGARLADLVAKYPPATRSGSPANIKSHPEDLPPYVSISTPDQAYYVGLDMESAVHAQTLLCYEMNGQPLTADHGAPLRLAIPVKYGIKNIKRIGTIKYATDKPADYWAEQGYDWYAGH